MNEPGANVRSVSDTALWVAYFRARETQRPAIGRTGAPGDFPWKVCVYLLGGKIFSKTRMCAHQPNGLGNHDS